MQKPCAGGWKTERAPHATPSQAYSTAIDIRNTGDRSMTKLPRILSLVEVDPRPCRGSVAPDHRHPPLRQINTRACRLSYSRAWLSGRNTSPGHMPR